MKIKVEETQTSIREVDVTFPVYVEGDFSGDDYNSVYYKRIEADGSFYEINKSFSYKNSPGQIEYSIEIGRMRLERDLGAYLDPKSDHYSVITANAFDAMVTETQAYLALFTSSQT